MKSDPPVSGSTTPRPLHSDTGQGPRLRLVGDGTPLPSTDPGGPRPITEPTDPRWVLAVRASEQLEGTILTPERRERLIRLGKMLGLTVFDASLVIAMVQDQARRGMPPADCAAAAEPQLRMLSAPRSKTERPSRAMRYAWIGVATVLVAAAELWLLRWLF